MKFKKKLLFTSLGQSVLGKTVHSFLSSGTQDLRHSLTQYEPPRPVNNIFIPDSYKKYTCAPTLTQNIEILQCVMFKTKCISSLTPVNTPCNLWGRKIPLTRQNLTKVVKCTISIAVIPAAGDAKMATLK